MAAVNPSNFLALLNLAWRTLVHFLIYPFRPRSRLADVVRMYDLQPRVMSPKALACVGCGKCSAVLPEAPALILRLGREAGGIPFSQPAVEKLAPVAEAVTAACPYGVDVPALLALCRAPASGN